MPYSTCAVVVLSAVTEIAIVEVPAVPTKTDTILAAKPWECRFEPGLPVEVLCSARAKCAGNVVLAGVSSSDLGVAATKSFRMDQRGAVDIRYRLSNRRRESVSVAPWEVTRVPRGGLTFFPLGARTYEDPRHPPLPFSRLGDIAWIDHEVPILEDRKLYSDSGKGYVANVRNGLVFVKEFERSSGGTRAPDEAELEIYENLDPPYVELEAQGPFAAIALGASITWNVRWRLLRLPEGARAAIGERTLVDLVESSLKR